MTKLSPTVPCGRHSSFQPPHLVVTIVPRLPYITKCIFTTSAKQRVALEFPRGCVQLRLTLAYGTRLVHVSASSTSRNAKLNKATTRWTFVPRCSKFACTTLPEPPNSLGRAAQTKKHTRQVNRHTAAYAHVGVAFANTLQHREYIKKQPCQHIQLNVPDRRSHHVYPAVHDCRASRLSLNPGPPLSPNLKQKLKPRRQNSPTTYSTAITSATARQAVHPPWPQPSRRNADIILVGSLRPGAIAVRFVSTPRSIISLHLLWFALLPIDKSLTHSRS